MFSCNTQIIMMNYLTQWLVISCSVTYIIIPTCSDECLMLPHLNYSNTDTTYDINEEQEIYNINICS